MHAIVSALAFVQVGNPHPTVWQNILHSFPTDPAALVTLVLALGAAIAVIIAGRSTSPKNGKDKGGLSA